MKVNYLIVGAGFTGATLAERLASQCDKKVLLIDRRNHIGGNAYDYYDERGILIHKYGPHIFHTNGKKIWDYLSQFTKWRPYQHRVLGVVDGQSVPIPFNLNSLYALFPPNHAKRLEDELIETFGFGVKVPILKMKEKSNGELSFLADYVYEKVFRNYTEKQWGLKPEELNPSVTARVPVSITRDNRYFYDRFQAMPKYGYTVLFNQMLSHPRIKILLQADYAEIADEIHYDKLIFTGPIDEYFNYCFGELPYRSLRFDFERVECEWYQDVATVNYPNENEFTRVTELKRLTGQRASISTLAYEYPQTYIRGQNDPYYPVPMESSQALFRKYNAEAKKIASRVIFAGRLGDYQYYNMDQAVARALTVFKGIVS